MTNRHTLTPSQTEARGQFEIGQTARMTGEDDKRAMAVGISFYGTQCGCVF